MTNINVSVLNGRNGFLIQGVSPDGRLGDAVSSAGDINGDGLADILVGARDVDITGSNNEGQVSIIFGSNEDFASRVAVSDLDESSGFNINGISDQQRLGDAVSNAGDINGDGTDDLIIGADGTANNRGSSYVVFGNPSIGSGVDLNALDGTNGFIVNGISEGDRLGGAVSDAGDLNGDGIADVVIGANFVDANGIEDAGASYVIFGRDGGGFTENIDLTTLDGTNGLVINGISPDDFSGFSVSSAGDLNGDGVDDLLIGANRADPNAGENAGTTYVVFGQAGGFAAGELDLANLGSNGITIDGVAAGDSSGASISALGDVNGDGRNDIGIGAPVADVGNDNAGQGYVVFGTENGFPETSLSLSSLDGSNGFTVNGVGVDDQLGTSISAAGDMNNDGVDDFVVSAVGTGNNRGTSYVVFGQESGEAFAPTLNLADLNINQGFAIDGITGSQDLTIADRSGESVSNLGDVNGDGLDDLLVGAPQANNFPVGQSDAIRDAGEAYVVFGRIENLGDVDNDGAYTNADAYGISRAAAGLITEFQAYEGIDPLLVADVNSDGVISALDSAIVYSAANDGTSNFILPDING
ncbi:conserved hypothetical protein [Hyella patelloides LEGE 07179]|uniref:FG-GAP repeat protein n=1 Tax=Hyella patelloides LEGE 07179 TaxID=945734 RepID=A0A563VZ65_9CYAN|nr:FG-GAP repeat protein [Hyella patelloides]VEP16752.1 conserved hypothetical protein [Hyella patelloides LEGE 07179]